MLAAPSASEAIALLREAPVDVLMSDISMPDVDGYELVRQARAWAEASGRGLRTVAVTAHIGDDVRQRALATGFDAYATKPLSADDLVSVLGSVTRR